MKYDKELVENHYGLVQEVINSYLKQHNFKSANKWREEIDSEGYYFLIKAAIDFDKSKGIAFHTYAASRIRAAIYNLIVKMIREEGRVTNIDFINEMELISEEYEPGKFDLIDEYEPEEEVNKRIYHELIMGNSTYKELGDELGMTKQAVRRRKQRLVERLKKQMEKK